MNDQHNIINRMVGVKLTVRFHTGNRKHKDLTGELESRHNISGKRSVGATVKLFGELWQKDITTAESKLRQWFYHRTLPWQDGGLRVIPTESYLKVFDEFAHLKAEFERGVNKLLADYDAVKADCKRRLNGAYRDDMFPLRHDLRNCYECTLDTQPIAVPDDFRVEGLDEAVVERIKAESWAHIGKALDIGVKDLTATVGELLSDARDRIQRASKGEKVKLGTLTEKASKCVERIRNLNVTGDGVLARAADDIERVLTKITADDIQNDKVAAKVLADTNSILRGMTGEPEPVEVEIEDPIPEPVFKTKKQRVTTPASAGYSDVLDVI